MIRLIYLGGVASLFALLVACDNGPSGPGSLNASVESPTLTAAALVLDVRGVGIRGFSATPPLQIFWGEGADPGSFTVVLVNPGDVAPLVFRVEVDDLAADPPSGTIKEATALTNLPILDPSSLVLTISP